MWAVSEIWLIRADGCRGGLRMAEGGWGGLRGIYAYISKVIRIFFLQTDYEGIPWGPCGPKKNCNAECIKLGQNLYFSNRFQKFGNVTKDRPSWKPGGVYIRSEPRPGNIRYLFLLLLPLGKGQREKKEKEKITNMWFLLPLPPLIETLQCVKGRC